MIRDAEFTDFSLLCDLQDEFKIVVVAVYSEPLPEISRRNIQGSDEFFVEHSP